MPSRPRNHTGSGGIENFASSVSNARMPATSPASHAAAYRRARSRALAPRLSRVCRCVVPGNSPVRTFLARCSALFTAGAVVANTPAASAAE